ncbi:hypothetical protein [Rhizobium leguminosarum]|uniref:hypothetical protein n=1 Tax=Rhizobium leguminosarum TaxID=384 RepID=UPI001249DEC2|nr:hypothetical protein [Rhizobium leguminosarum]
MHWISRLFATGAAFTLASIALDGFAQSVDANLANQQAGRGVLAFPRLCRWSGCGDAWQGFVRNMGFERRYIHPAPGFSGRQR